MIAGLRDGLHWGAGGWVNGERSPDLPRVIGAMHQLAAISCPDLPVKQARQRWAAYVGREADLDLLVP